MGTVRRLTIAKPASGSAAPEGDALRTALRACRPHFVNAAVFSFAINLLYLAAPLYMLQVYDRVISSASVVTLVMLTLILLGAFLALAGLDAIRARLLTRASAKLDKLMAGRLLTALLENERDGAHGQALRDFDTFRQFITGRGIHALFDLPWTPVYTIVIFMLHPALGAFALACTVILIALALLNEVLTHAPLREANEAATRNYAFTDMSLRNAEVVQAMGMARGVMRRWARDRLRMIEQQGAASDRAATTAAVIRFLRLSMQSLILGLGAYLVIGHAVTAGAIFAGSLLLGRSLQPVEQIVASWRNIVAARDAFTRIRALLTAHPQHAARLELPRPTGRLSIEALSYAAPQTTKLILRGMSLQIQAGETIGIIGPSGAGKSTFVRHVVGLLKPSTGVVRLDGADVATWPRNDVGRHIGYLPQDVELFADTIAANIGRFGTASSAEIIAAAQLAGVHDMILHLPDGYETHVGDGGAVLSGGYRQRIGLARAVLGNPALVVLDEPSSNLDTDGDVALAACIQKLKANRTTVLVVSHRASTIAAADKVLMLVGGAVEAFGPRAEVLARFNQRPPMTVIAR